MNKISKKGDFEMSKLGNFLLILAVCAIIGTALWMLLVNGSLLTLKKSTACGTLMGFKGECRVSCDPYLETEYPGGGCAGQASKCCVRKEENMADVILPSGYGGSQDYDFKVVSIAVKNLPSGCRPASTNADNSYVCTPDNKYTIPIEITVQNVNKALEVYADPVIVINGNGDNIIKSTYTGTAKTSLNTAGQNGIVTTNIEISSSDAKANDYWEIYPYAKCITNNCKATNAGSDGILSMNEKEFVTITFENVK
jgi:hypothetical protein